MGVEGHYLIAVVYQPDEKLPLIKVKDLRRKD